MLEPIVIDDDIRRASTLPSAVYCESRWFEATCSRVLPRSWQFLGNRDLVAKPGACAPLILLPGSLNEPVVLTRAGDDRVRCLSNVCTHRGNIVAHAACEQKTLRCRYHGRRFGLDGAFLSMPEFDDVEKFPSSADDLPNLELATWKQFLFASLRPALPASEWLAPVDARVGWMPIESFTFDAATSRDYHVDANWALYCDNYLEGFHIPFVHDALADTLDYGDYRTELFDYGNLQVGIQRGGEAPFDLPPESPDAGEDVAAYYFWLFPNLMLNFYPWGLSVNVVEPLAVNRTRVRFLSYVWDASKRARGAGAGLDRVELEDEEIVESVQLGVASRLYDRGRYSPRREAGVHHFHRLLAQFLNRTAGP